jgi:flagellar basal-body rod protein FlgB
MSWVDTGTEQILRYMDLLSVREKLVVGNIANIDTPGYKTLDINFHDALQRADRDLDGDPQPPTVQPVPDLIERPDGNNVSLDRESVILAGIQLEYNMAIALLKQDFSSIELAINENNGE